MVTIGHRDIAHFACFGLLCCLSGCGNDSRGPWPPAPSPPAPSPPSPALDGYSVIVIGAGMMGSAVAGRLAEKLDHDQKMLILEAGAASHVSAGGQAPPASCTSSRCAPWPTWPTNGPSRFDVPGNYQELPCWDKSCAHAWHELPAFQCKVLGGCGVTNGALMQRPARENFDTWPEGWRHDDLQRYVEDVEATFPITATPSRDGKHYLDETGGSALRSVLAGAGFQWVEDTMEPRDGEMGIPRVAAKDGIRMSSVNVLLEPALQDDRVHLLLNAEATELLLEGTRAIGVRFTQAGVSKVASLKSTGFLVLSGGAMNTPRLLLSSGIGSSDLMGAQALKVENANVGRGISDHSIAWSTFKFPGSGIGSFLYRPPSEQVIDMYTRNRTGPLAQFGPTLVAFFKDASSQSGFDVEIFVNPAESDDMLKVYFVLMRPQCSSANLRLSGGTVSLDGNVHIACDRDRQVMQSAVDLVHARMIEAGASSVPDSNAWPHTNDMNHWAGTCKLGSCADAATLTVHGTTNVVVADASLLPTQIWAHPALTLKAMSLKIADVLSSHLAASPILV